MQNSIPISGGLAPATPKGHIRWETILACLVKLRFIMLQI